MPKKKSEEFDLEDILSSLDDEDEEVNDVEDLLATLDDDKDNTSESINRSFNDYAASLIKDIEDEKDDNLSALGSMIESNEESDLDCNELMSILDNLDSLEDEENNSDEDDELIGLLSEDEKDDLDKKLDEYKQNKVTETDDLATAGLTISNDGVITQTSFNKKLKKLTIKKSYNGINVRKLISAICSEDDDIELEEVIFEGDIYIESCFEGCPSLYNIVAKRSLEIGPYNFAATPNLDVEVDGNRYVRINKNDYYVLNKGVYRSPFVSVKDGCNLINAHAFLFSKIGMIDIPSSVKKIGRSAFAECYELDYVSFSEGLQFIGESAFNGCRKLESIDLPDSLLFIGSDAFNGCDNLHQVTLSKNTKYADDAFPLFTKLVFK